MTRFHLSLSNVMKSTTPELAVLFERPFVTRHKRPRFFRLHTSCFQCTFVAGLLNCDSKQVSKALQKVLNVTLRQMRRRITTINANSPSHVLSNHGTPAFSSFDPSRTMLQLHHVPSYLGKQARQAGASTSLVIFWNDLVSLTLLH